MACIQGANGIRASAGFSASVGLLFALIALLCYVGALKNCFAMLTFLSGTTSVEDNGRTCIVCAQTLEQVNMSRYR